MPALPVGADEQQSRLARKLTFDSCATRPVARAVRRHALECRRHLQAVSWTYLAPEPRLVDAAEQNHSTGETIIGENCQSPCLSQRFYDQNAGKHRVAGKVTAEERLFSCEVPSRDSTLTWLDLDYLVHKEKWRPMGQHVLGIEHGCRR